MPIPRRQIVRGNADHQFPESIATDPSVTFRVEPLPSRDFAATALNEARETYRKRYPHADMESLVWTISFER